MGVRSLLARERASESVEFLLHSGRVPVGESERARENE